jgi:GATA zinc finger
VRQSGRVVDALGRIKDAVIAQQHALAEEQARALKREHYEDDLTGFSGDFKENGGFAAGDSKKRRGVSLDASSWCLFNFELTSLQKAAPPGRCHSCNRAETPEWRRGPDGARTLCNACGLHYAKLTRKIANKNASHSGSNLRPKHSEAHPPM